MLTEISVIKIPLLFYKGRKKGTTTITFQLPKSVLPDSKGRYKLLAPRSVLCNQVFLT